MLLLATLLSHKYHIPVRQRTAILSSIILFDISVANFIIKRFI